MTKVSVIIPTYNGARFLREAIDSVLAQTYEDYEIIVVDDGSTDDTATILHRYGDRIIPVHQSNQKLSAARNNGVAASKGKYIAFLDSDDQFLPDKLQLQARILDENPEVGLVASGFEQIDEAGQAISTIHPWLYFPSVSLESILFYGLAPPSAVMMRRDWFERVGGFDPAFFYTEDMDFWYRLALSECPMAWSPSVLLRYRIHALNKSRSSKIHYQYFRKAIERAFADSRLPDEIRTRRAEIDAIIDLSEAARLAAGGWKEAASERVRRAVATNPSLKISDGYGLAEIAVSHNSTVWSDGRFSEFVASVMQDEIPNLMRTIGIVTLKKRFYNSFGERRTDNVLRTWFDIARRDPRWLLNRGGWSILRQSIMRREHQIGARE